MIKIRTIANRTLIHTQKGGAQGLMGLMGLMRPMRPMSLMGHMRPMSLIWPICFMSLMSLMSLVGCSSDEGVPGQEPQETVVNEVEASLEMDGVMGYVTGFEGNEEELGVKGAYGALETRGAVTRGWELPSGFSIYGDGEQPVSVFFTQTSGEPVGGYLEERFYKYPGGQWHCSKDDLAAESYYLYGYIPRNKSIVPSVEVLPGGGTTYADGAKLTLNNVPTVSSDDICVIIGAKNGFGSYDPDHDYPVDGLRRGNFEYVARTTGEGGTGGNYVYLLFDHLFSSMRIYMRVHGDYDAIRTIKLKEMRLQTSANGVRTKNKTNIIVTLAATDGSNPTLSPITSVVFNPASDKGSDGALYSSTDDGVTLTTTPTEFEGYFMPSGVTTLTLTSTYDVYDKSSPTPNLIRQNCTATNVINISDLFSGQTVALRGRRYTLNLTVRPTYLYMMSDDDLNNPGIVVE